MKGPAFMPEALKRRINVFNKQHGYKPPADHKMREWNPQSIPAIHDKKNYANLSSQQHKSSFQQKKVNVRPFANHDSKVKTGQTPTINSHY